MRLVLVGGQDRDRRLVQQPPLHVREVFLAIGDHIESGGAVNNLALKRNLQIAVRELLSDPIGARRN